MLAQGQSPERIWGKDLVLIRRTGQMLQEGLLKQVLQSYGLPTGQGTKQGEFCPRWASTCALYYNLGFLSMKHAMKCAACASSELCNSLQTHSLTRELKLFPCQFLGFFSPAIWHEWDRNASPLLQLKRGIIKQMFLQNFHKTPGK